MSEKCFPKMTKAFRMCDKIGIYTNRCFDISYLQLQYKNFVFQQHYGDNFDFIIPRELESYESSY